MKGTREQRIKRLEDSKQSFTSWVAYDARLRYQTLWNRNGEDEISYAENLQDTVLPKLHQYDE